MRQRIMTIIVAVLALVIVLVLWNNLFFSPAGSDVDKAKQRRDDAQQQNTELAAKKRKLEKNHQNGTEVQAQLAKLQSAIPATPDLEGFLRAAYDVKQKSGVDWVSIQPAPPSPGAGPSEIKMQIVVKGGFFQVLDYLNRFEDPASMRRLVVVDGISVTAGAAGTTGSTGSSGSSTPTTAVSSPGGPQLDVTLDARMFTQAAPSSSGNGSSGTPTTPTTKPGATTSTSAGGTQ